MSKPGENPRKEDGGGFSFKRLFTGVPGRLRGALSKIRFPGKTDLSALKTRAGGLLSRLFHAKQPPKTEPGKVTASTPTNFRDAAKKILKDHPELSRKTLIVNLATHKWTGSLRAKLKGALSHKFKARLRQAEKEASTGTAPAGGLIRGKHIDAVVVSPGKDGDGKFQLYQEAGQLLGPGGLGKYFSALFGISPAATEASGDAYAVIRHLKEYGMASGGLSPLSTRRALDFIQSGETEHLTSFVVDKVLADRNFADLKPAEVVITVQKYVEAYAPSRETSEKLAKDFAPLKGKLKPLTEDSLKQLAAITTAPQADAATFYLGQRALQEFFRDSQGVDMTTAYWTEAKAAIAKRLETVTLETLFARPAAPLKPKAP